MSSCSNDSSGYRPSSIVDAFHNIPHVDIDLEPSSSQFKVTVDYFQVSAVNRSLYCSNRLLSCFCCRLF